MTPLPLPSGARRWRTQGGKRYLDLQLGSAGVVFHRAVILCFCAAGLALPGLAGAAAPIRGQTLMPGVVYSRQLEFTAHGPVAMHIVAAPRPTGLYALKTILSNDAVTGTERVTSMERRYSGSGTAVAVSAALSGVIRGGTLDTAPADERSSAGIDADGSLHVDRVPVEGTGQAPAQRRILAWKTAPPATRATFYTREWGARTPAEKGGASGVLQPFPASKPNAPLTATVTGYLP